METYRKKAMYKLIEGSEYIPEIIYKAYTQTISAYNEEATILAGIGFRAIIEAICAEQSVKEHNLQASINKLNENGILSKQDTNLLHSIRFLGNDAAHEIKEPTQGQLETTRKIIEHLLVSLYILPHDVKRLMETVIDTYEEFESLLSKSILGFKSGDELPIKGLLGGQMRRFLDKSPDLINELVSRINAGAYMLLKIGKIDNYQGSSKKMQHFIVN